MVKVRDKCWPIAATATATVHANERIKCKRYIWPSFESVAHLSTLSLTCLHSCRKHQRQSLRSSPDRLLFPVDWTCTSLQGDQNAFPVPILRSSNPTIWDTHLLAIVELHTVPEQNHSKHMDFSRFKYFRRSFYHSHTSWKAEWYIRMLFNSRTNCLAGAYPE